MSVPGGTKRSFSYGLIGENIVGFRMSRRTKLWIQLIVGILILAAIFWIPEIAVILAVILAIIYIFKKLWNVPIAKIKK